MHRLLYTITCKMQVHEMIEIRSLHKIIRTQPINYGPKKKRRLQFLPCNVIGCDIIIYEFIDLFNYLFIRYRRP